MNPSQNNQPQPAQGAGGSYSSVQSPMTAGPQPHAPNHEFTPRGSQLPYGQAGAQMGTMPSVANQQAVNPQGAAPAPSITAVNAAPPPYAGALPEAPSGAGVAAPAGAAVHASPGVKPVAKNPNSTQNSLQIAEIRDGIVIMNDGSYRSVVMVKSINFDLMSQGEQEAVEYSYQGFLNSLYFPIQIFIRSQKVDLQPYIEKLDKIRTEHDNMLLALLMEDYIDYIDQLAQQTNIMDKKFYIVIPYFPEVDTQKAISQSKNFLTGIVALFDKKEQHVVINEESLEKAKTELRNRVQSVMGGLMQCGIQGLPLDTQELIELFYDTYNPDTATRQQLKNFGSLDADIVTKGLGTAAQSHLQRELQ